MKKYKVVLHPDAETDIHSAYKWGRQVWGEKEAKAWAVELRRIIRSRLTSVPLGCAIAPESEQLDIPVRNLIVGRYRVLFIVEKRVVAILHVRGAYVRKLHSNEDVDD
jgi:plasmid stabilization system protein ParE